MASPPIPEPFTLLRPGREFRPAHHEAKGLPFISTESFVSSRVLSKTDLDRSRLEYDECMSKQYRHLLRKRNEHFKRHMSEKTFNNTLTEVENFDKRLFEKLGILEDHEATQNSDFVGDEGHRSHLDGKGNSSVDGRKDEGDGDLHPATTMALPSSQSVLGLQATSSRSGAGFLEQLKGTLDELSGSRAKPRKTAHSAPANPTEEKGDTLPPTRTFKMQVDKQKRFDFNSNSRQRQDAAPAQEGDWAAQTVTWVEKFVVQEQILYTGAHRPPISHTSKHISTPSPAFSTVSLSKHASCDTSASYAYESTHQLTPTPTSTSSVLSSRTRDLDYWFNFDIPDILADFPMPETVCQSVPSSCSRDSSYWFDLDVPDIPTEISMPEVATAATGQSVPSPTTTSIENQRSKFTKSELRKRDVIDQLESVEPNAFELSKITSTMQEPPTPSISPTFIQSNRDPEPEPDSLDEFRFYQVTVDVNPNEASKVTATIHQDSLTTISSPATPELEEQDNYRPELKRREEWDDWEEWFDRVKADRDEYLFNERQTILESYTLQGPGGRTLEEARLQDNSLFDWGVLNKENNDRYIPDTTNCRLDDMTEAPGPGNLPCDPPDRMTHAQISAGSTINPLSNTFAVFVAFLVLCFLLLPFFRSRDPAEDIEVPHGLTYSDSDAEEDDIEDYPYPEEDSYHDYLIDVDDKDSDVWSARCIIIRNGRAVKHFYHVQGTEPGF